MRALLGSEREYWKSIHVRKLERRVLENTVGVLAKCLHPRPVASQLIFILCLERPCLFSAGGVSRYH